MGDSRENYVEIISEVNSWAVSRRQGEVVGKFKMAAGDVISIRGQVLEHMYVPTRIKRELLRFGNRKA